MDFFDADTEREIAEHARHETALSRIEPIVQKGINFDIQRRADKLMALPLQFHEKHREVITVLETTALDRTMKLLAEFSADTVEYLTKELAETNSAIDCMHEILGDQSNWRRIAGDNREEMFRDAVSIRHVTMMPTSWDAYAMLEAYRATGLLPGEIHPMGDGPDRNTFTTLVIIGRRSRRISSLLANQAIRNDKTISTEMRKVLSKESYKKAHAGPHLTPEFARLLIENPKKGFPLIQFMNERKEPLSALDLDLFDEHARTATPLKAGVL